MGAACSADPFRVVPSAAISPWASLTLYVSPTLPQDDEGTWRLSALLTDATLDADRRQALMLQSIQRDGGKINPALRWAVWPCLLRAEELLSTSSLTKVASVALHLGERQHESELAKAVSVAARDVPRTAPELRLLQGRRPGRERRTARALLRLLTNLAALDEDVRYVQSINFIAVQLLLAGVRVEAALACMLALTRTRGCGLASLYLAGLRDARLLARAAALLMQKRAPKARLALKAVGPILDGAIVPWLMAVGGASALPWSAKLVTVDALVIEVAQAQQRAVHGPSPSANGPCPAPVWLDPAVAGNIAAARTDTPDAGAGAATAPAALLQSATAAAVAASEGADTSTADDRPDRRASPSSGSPAVSVGVAAAPKHVPAAEEGATSPVRGPTDGPATDGPATDGPATDGPAASKPGPERGPSPAAAPAAAPGRAKHRRAPRPVDAPLTAVACALAAMRAVEPWLGTIAKAGAKHARRHRRRRGHSVAPSGDDGAWAIDAVFSTVQHRWLEQARARTQRAEAGAALAPLPGPVSRVLRRRRQRAAGAAAAAEVDGVAIPAHGVPEAAPAARASDGDSSASSDSDGSFAASDDEPDSPGGAASAVIPPARRAGDAALPHLPRPLQEPRRGYAFRAQPATGSPERLMGPAGKAAEAETRRAAVDGALGSVRIRASSLTSVDGELCFEWMHPKLWAGLLERERVWVSEQARDGTGRTRLECAVSEAAAQLGIAPPPDSSFV